MMNIQLYNVAPKIPDELSFLEELSYNIWWCWHPAAVELFVRISPELWSRAEGNSRKFLSMVPQKKLEELVGDKAYMKQLELVKKEFKSEVAPEHDQAKKTIAYFSMEFGLHESIRLYSGGLGILAGDHLKAAADLDLPLVAVGLLYREGYFRQRLDRNGWQIERYPENEINHMPLTRACDENNAEVFITIKLMDRDLIASVWTLRVGNITLVLLDTEIPQNPPEFREITARLYGGDHKMRLEQELLLGIGGFKALTKLGYDPAVCHMNEGHAAFLSLARIAYLVKEKNMSPDAALEVVWRTNIFTTHTPVPAGNEVFALDIVRPYIEVLQNDVGMDIKRMLDWGIPIGSRTQADELSMTVLGLRMGSFSNGVSRLHGEEARLMWRHLWPERAIDEIPIDHITNGVHIASWISKRKRHIYSRYLNINWNVSQSKEQLEQHIGNIPNEELWMAHELCRHSMIRRARRQLQKTMKAQLNYQGDSQTAKTLDPSALTIGFARRFATYKRGTLLLRNRERLKALLNNSEQPVQFIFAGKAHPADDEGKRLIQELVSFSLEPDVNGRVIFLEDYDISLARDMVQGVDVWLNTPLRPQEASGTSGMKAAVNGVLNCSILDGWWDEAYTPESGWAIAGDENYDDPEDCDNFESMYLFNLLEKEIIPKFYDRTDGDIPVKWIEMMKSSIVMALSSFSSARMVTQYNEKFYLPAQKNYRDLVANNAKLAKSLVEEKVRLVENFDKIYLESPQVDVDLVDIHVGDTFQVTVKVYLRELKPEDVDIELYYGNVNTQNEIIESNIEIMAVTEDYGDGHYLYKHALNCVKPGRFGLSARITPQGDRWRTSIPGFICGAKN